MSELPANRARAAKANRSGRELLDREADVRRTLREWCDEGRENGWPRMATDIEEALVRTVPPLN